MSPPLYVVVRSPAAAASRRLIDALEPSLRALPRSVVRAVEHGPEQARRIFKQRRWLFAEVGDLERASVAAVASTRDAEEMGSRGLSERSCFAYEIAIG